MMRTREEVEKKIERFERYWSLGDHCEAFCLVLELLLDIRDILVSQRSPPTPPSGGLFGRVYDLFETPKTKSNEEFINKKEAA